MLERYCISITVDVNTEDNNFKPSFILEKLKEFSEVLTFGSCKVIEKGIKTIGEPGYCVSFIKPKRKRINYQYVWGFDFTADMAAEQVLKTYPGSTILTTVRVKKGV